MTKDANLYGTAKVQIPAPEFVVFYNGQEWMPEQDVIRLSDMFTVNDRPVKLELEATVLNISGDNNQALKAACRTLREYAVYTDKIRQYTEEMPLEEAVDRAIRECIREDVLKEFLENHRAEAKEMSIFEYDQEKHMRQEREAAWKAGMEEGMRSGIEKVRRSGIKEGISQGKEEFLKTLIQRKLAKNKSIAEIAAELEETEEHIRQVMTRISD